MPQVINDRDNAFTLTLSNREMKVLERWSADANRTKAKLLEQVLDKLIQDKGRDYYTDPVVPGLQDRYRKASPAVQNQVDALLP